MKSVGIICEYNPLHNGHLYHLKKIKEKFPDYTVVLVLSPTRNLNTFKNQKSHKPL